MSKIGDVLGVGLRAVGVLILVVAFAYFAIQVWILTIQWAVDQ